MACSASGVNGQFEVLLFDPVRKGFGFFLFTGMLVQYFRIYPGLHVDS